MRFNFELTESYPDSSSRKSLTPKEDIQWVPLQNHPLFASSGEDTAPRSPSNLLAWAALLDFTIGTQTSDVLAASISNEVLQTAVEINFEVNKISINMNGSAMPLSGTNGLCVMYLYGRSSGKDNAIVCSVCKWESALEIYSDAETFGLKSANPVAVDNLNLEISWLEATFPELAHESKEGGFFNTKSSSFCCV
ncbi:hypothetical protein OIU76_013343 [Salix suchowensis]|nr:hypothetical protein OIU76_013343 [Salix suchowensis]